MAGTRVTNTTVVKRLADHAPGATVEVAFFRKDRLRAARLRLARNPERKWSFAIDDQAPPRRKALRQRWLGTKTDG